jgi:glycosidase
MEDIDIAASFTRPVIYQLMVRTFGNTNETRKIGGTLVENGCGTFSDINERALVSLREMGFTHLWLTGVIEQASGTAYPNRPADDSDVLKGIAGSPYAIRDYFDVCPDYAIDPENRLGEFKELLARCHAFGFRVIIDFIPNHVARSYASDVMPDWSFGEDDRKDVFFDRDNHFFYLRSDDPGGGPPLKLPTADLLGCDGRFVGESEYGRVTGNNVISWAPSRDDWYEVVKLNYGHDFTKGRDTSALPGENSKLTEVPKTWRFMDRIIAYWQELGVDGFRADMAHLIPMEFWCWSVKRARARDGQVFFCAEAYDNDPAKLTDGHVLDELLKAGFDAVYDDPAYDVLEGIYDSGKWANDLEHLIFTGERFHRSLRYAETHDEVRLANPREWGGVGMAVGKPVSAVLFAMGRGPVMVYHGQEVGEPAVGAEGFCGDNARTTIFDYWSMPEFSKWVNGGRFDGQFLSESQMSLRRWYGRMLRVIGEPAFTRGEFYSLNHANRGNSEFGRIDGESVSGHWIYAFIRHDRDSGQSFLVVVNLHPDTSLEVVVSIPEDAWKFIERDEQYPWTFVDRLGQEWAGQSNGNHLRLPCLGACSAVMLEIVE